MFYFILFFIFNKTHGADWTNTRLVYTHLNAFYAESKFGKENLNFWNFSEKFTCRLHEALAQRGLSMFNKLVYD